MAGALRIVIVGGGSIGQRHLANLMRLRGERSRGGRSLYLALADRDPAARRAAADAGAQETYDELSAALQAHEFDVAVICSPNHLHVEQARMALEGGCHVFVEKPLATAWQSADGLGEAASRNGKHVMVGCNLRFHPAVKALSRALEEDSIGRPLYARAVFAHYLPNWRRDRDYRQSYSARADQGGGILLDAIHEPDYLCWLFGPATGIRGEVWRLGDLEIDVEDTAAYTMTHDSGVVSEVHVDFLRRDKLRACEICGVDGTLTWRSAGKNPESVTVRRYHAASDEWATLYENAAFDLNEPYVEELRYFLDALDAGTAPMNGPDEAMAVLRIVDTVRQAAAEKPSIAPA